MGLSLVVLLIGMSLLGKDGCVFFVGHERVFK